MADVAVRNPPRVTRWFPFDRSEAPRLAMMYGFVAVLHVAGWSLFLSYGHRFGVGYAAAGGLAYSFGLRHAFDADHLSAVDDTTRFLMQRGQRPLGTGFFFSLGHSTVVVALCLGLGVAATTVQAKIPALQHIGGTVGATISGTFLLVIAALDAIILVGIVQVWRRARSGAHRPEELDELMMQRGFLNRILGSRWRRLVSQSWHLYPVGVLFGLGLDTASEIGLLALTASASGGHRPSFAGGAGGAAGHAGLPFGAVIALPLLFAAGMTLMDTTDGIFMSRAYGWAFENPLRKIYYNLVTVALGVLVAGMVGLVEYLQVLHDHVHFHGAFWSWLGSLDFELLGYVIVGAFAATWLSSMLLYKLRRYEDQAGPARHERCPP